MTSLVKTLQHKASRSRLRKSVASVASDDAPSLPGSASPSAAGSSSGSSNANAGSSRWWKKRDSRESPASSSQTSPHLQQYPEPKPILLRRDTGRKRDRTSTSPGTPAVVRFPDSRSRAAQSSAPSAYNANRASAPASSYPPPINTSVVASHHISMPVPPSVSAPVTPVMNASHQLPAATPSPTPSSNLHGFNSPGDRLSPSASLTPGSSSTHSPSLSASPAPSPSPRLSRRSSRAISRLGPHSVARVPVPPLRPSSAMSTASTASGTPRRRSSRPMASGAGRTRASIASAPYGMPSQSPTSPSSASNSPPSSSGHGSRSSDYPATMYVVPPGVAVQRSNRSSVMSRVSVASRSSARSSYASGTSSSSTVTSPIDTPPQFNFIPATPQQTPQLGGDEFAPLSAPARKPAPPSISRTSSYSTTLEHLPEEEDEERQLGSAWDEQPRTPTALSPRLDDLTPTSPLRINVRPLDELDESEDEDDARTAGALTPTPANPQVPEPARAADRAAASKKPVLAVVPPGNAIPPPVPAKSPARKYGSLYQAHDDGRSISQSLAELAALACDLPPLGDELTLNASKAADRLAAARMAADAASAPGTPRLAPTVAPSRPIPPIPTEVEVEHEELTDLLSPTSPTDADIRTPTTPQPETPPAHAAALPDPESPSTPPRTQRALKEEVGFGYAAPCDPLPPSPPFNSYPSLPSLMSHESMPSSTVESLQSFFSHGSSTPASPDAEEALGRMLRTLGSGGSVLNFDVLGLFPPITIEEPTTPKTHTVRLDEDDTFGTLSNPASPAPASLGLDFSAPRANTPSTPRPTPGMATAEKLASPCVLSSSPATPRSPRRIHRMSAAAANPYRSAFYGSPPALFRTPASEEDLRLGGPVPIGHTPRESISSMSLMSDASDDDLLTASIVALTPFAPYVVGREDARAHEVGVAF